MLNLKGTETSIFIFFLEDHGMSNYCITAYLTTVPCILGDSKHDVSVSIACRGTLVNTARCDGTTVWTGLDRTGHTSTIS